MYNDSAEKQCSRGWRDLASLAIAYWERADTELKKMHLLNFVASLFVSQVDNRKEGVDNKKVK